MCFKGGLSHSGERFLIESETIPPAARSVCALKENSGLYTQPRLSKWGNKQRALDRATQHYSSQPATGAVGEG